jgi:hypothetical protein
MSCRALSLPALPGYWILSCLSKVSFAQSAEWAPKTEFSGLKSCFLFSLLGLYVHGCDSQAPFGESGKTVTSADIHEFFEDFNQKRRRRNWHFEATRDDQTHWSLQNGVFLSSFQCYMLLLRYLEHIFCIWYPWEGNGLKTNLVLFKFSNLLVYEELVIVTMGTKLKQIHSRAEWAWRSSVKSFKFSSNVFTFEQNHHCLSSYMKSVTYDYCRMNLSLNLIIKHLGYIKMHRSIGNWVVGRGFFGVEWIFHFLWGLSMSWFSCLIAFHLFDVRILLVGHEVRKVLDKQCKYVAFSQFAACKVQTVIPTYY